MRWAWGGLLALALLPLLGIVAPVHAEAIPGHDATVLLFHPLDHVDPFGIPFEGADPFAARYQSVAAQTGQFDYPVFVADGIRVIQGLPDPARPYQGTLEAYEAAVQERRSGPPALALTLTAQITAGQVVLSVMAEPNAPIQQSQGQTLRLRVAVAEDPVHYQPAAGPLFNGVVDHRFTVRAYRELGTIALDGRSDFTTAIPLDSKWQEERLLAAAWVQADGAPGRFGPTEVLQATHASLNGTPVRQATKGVLVEAYSATWCTPCLYGDLAAEELALRHAGAQALPQPPARYLEAPTHPIPALLVAAAAGLAVAFLPRGHRA